MHTVTVQHAAAVTQCAGSADCIPCCVAVQLRNMVTSLSASKADGSNLLQHQQHCQQQLLELQRGLAAAQSAASEAAVAAAVAKTALEPVDALRLQLAETQGTVAALQATAAGGFGRHVLRELMHAHTRQCGWLPTITVAQLVNCAACWPC